MQRITKIKPFEDKYNWEGITYPSKQDDQKKFEKNDLIIALSILYAKEEENVYPAYISKYNSKYEKQLNDSKRGRMSLYYRKTITALLKGIVPKHHSEFWCYLNCLLKTLKYYSLINTKKSDKAPFILYADLECLIEKFGGCKNDSENLFTTEVCERIPSGVSMCTISLFKNIRNKHDGCRGKDSMKKFYKSLKEHAVEIITKRTAEITSKGKNKSKISKITSKIKNIAKDHSHYAGKYRNSAHNICNLKYIFANKVTVVFHTGSNHDYHFIIKMLVEEFEG